MAAPQYDLQRSPSSWAPPVARFFALVPVSGPAAQHRSPASTARSSAALMLAPEPELQTVPDEVERPTLRVIPGGAEAARRRRRPQQVYRRRRLVACVAAVSMFLVLAAVVAPVLHDSATAGSSAAPTDATATVATSAATSAGAGDQGGDFTYLVQPGDTLWSIAASMDAPGDIRALVDELSRRAGPGPLVAGTRLDISAL